MSKPVDEGIGILELVRISGAEGSSVMRVNIAEHLVDAVSPIRIRSPVEKLSQMRRRDVNGGLNRFLQQTVQGKDPVRLYAVLLWEGTGMGEMCNGLLQYVN